jgi:hypothetical protein
MFKVWIDVEELDSNGDSIASSCWLGPACAEFPSYAEANQYADRLFELSQRLKQLQSDLRPQAETDHQ